MNVSLVKLANNYYSIEYEHRHLHSLKDPWREAERIVNSQLKIANFQKRVSRERVPIFFLINPGIGYAALVLRKLYPRAQIYAVYSDKLLYDMVLNCENSCIEEKEAIPMFEAVAFTDYLFTILDRFLPLSVQLIDWFPASCIPGHRQLLGEYLSAIETIQADILTRIHFGKRWIENIRLNCGKIEDLTGLASLNGPVVLCAAGPSLRDAIPMLRKLRSKIHLWALPSSTRMLCSEGIKPDCVVSSDGGYWAGLHLRYVPRETHVIMALSARVPAEMYQQWQSKEFVSLQMPFVRKHENLMSLPEKPSVVFTALDILDKVSNGPVILFAADFSTRALQSHARPQAFDEFIESSGDRLHPLCTERFKRCAGKQLDIYARWFATHIARSDKCLYRWRGTGVHLPIPEVHSMEELATIIDSSPPMGARWSQRHFENVEEEIFLPLPHPLPHDLFSGQGHRNLFESLMYRDGIQLKKYYLQWLHGKNEKACVQEFEKNRAVPGRRR